MDQAGVVRSDTSVAEVVRAIEDSRSKVAIVVDSERRVLGVITDGDVRRGLLAGKGFDAIAADIMNSEPKTLLDGAPRAAIIEAGRRHRVRHLPVVDSDGRLLRVETPGALAAPERRPEPAVILAGGRGVRLMPLTEDCPKPMLPVGGKPIMEHTLEKLQDSGFYEFYVSVNYLAHKIVEYFGDGSKYGVSIQYLYEDAPLGTGGPLSLLPEAIRDLSVLAINGDIMTDVNFGNLADYHVAAEASATMCVRSHSFEVPFGVVEVEDGTLRALVEKPTYTVQVNAGIYMIGPSVRALAQPGERVDMPELFERGLRNGLASAVYPVHEDWTDVGRHEDLERARRSKRS